MVLIDYSEESLDFPHHGVSWNIKPAGKEIIIKHNVVLWVMRTEVPKSCVVYDSLCQAKFGIKKISDERGLGHAANYTSRALMLSSHFVPNTRPGGPLLVNCALSSCSDLTHVSPFPLSPGLLFYISVITTSRASCSYTKLTLISTPWCLFYSVQCCKYKGHLLCNFVWKAFQAGNVEKWCLEISGGK